MLFRIYLIYKMYLMYPKFQAHSDRLDGVMIPSARLLHSHFCARINVGPSPRLHLGSYQVLMLQCGTQRKLCCKDVLWTIRFKPSSFPSLTLMKGGLRLLWPLRGMGWFECALLLLSENGLERPVLMAYWENCARIPSQLRPP